jgi:hypothetical protein
MTITGGLPLRSGTLHYRRGTKHGTPLLVSRLPIHRCGLWHRQRFLPKRGRQGRGQAIGLYEPRRERKPNAPPILPDMRDACLHSK